MEEELFSLDIVCKFGEFMYSNKMLFFNGKLEGKRPELHFYDKKGMVTIIYADTTEDIFKIWYDCYKEDKV